MAEVMVMVMESVAASLEVWMRRAVAGYCGPRQAGPGRARTLVTVGLGRPKQCTASSQQPAAASHPTRAASCERRGGRDATKPPRSGVRLSPRHHRTVPMAGRGGVGPHFAGCSRPTGRADALPTGMDGFTETYCQTRQWRSQANHTGGSGRGCSLPVSHTLEGVPPWVPPAACSSRPSALRAYGKSPTGFRSCTASLSRARRGGVEQQGEESF